MKMLVTIHSGKVATSMLMNGFDVAHVMQHNMWWLVGCGVAFGQGQAPHVEHRPHFMDSRLPYMGAKGEGECIWAKSFLETNRFEWQTSG